MDAVKVGEQALVGWREKVADGAAKPFETRTKIQPEQVRAVVGALFFGLSVYYVIGTARRAVREARQG
jgi:hypothetical protein